MLRIAFLFLAVGVGAGILGFAGIAGTAIPVAKFFAVLFGLLSLGFFLIGTTDRTAPRRSGGSGRTLPDIPGSA
jgi:uncharacterized membrane protein YtjA (UPF0391 family)